MAASVEFEDDNGRVVRYVRHANGGGLVSPLARVHEAAMVASTAYVEAGAQVGDRSRIGAGSWLDRGVDRVVPVPAGPGSQAVPTVDQIVISRSCCRNGVGAWSDRTRVTVQLAPVRWVT